MKNERLGPDAWTDAALEALADHGVAAVAVEPLARVLGVTKGSFYWHFETREDLLRATAERWEALGTTAVIARIRAIEDPRARIVALLEAAHGSGRGLRVASALSGLADHPTVGPVVQRLTTRRLDFLAECYRGLGLTEARAQRAARLAYASYLGLGELERLGIAPTGDRQRAAYVAQLVDTLVPKDAPRKAR